MTTARLARFARRVAAAALSFAAIHVSAHDVPPGVVMLDIGRTAIAAELQLPLGDLGAALQLPLASQPLSAVWGDSARIERYVREHLSIRGPDGRAWTMGLGAPDLRKTANANWTSNDWLVLHASFEAPAGASTEVFALDDTVIVERVPSHQAVVYVRRDLRNALLGDRPMAIATLGFGSTHVDVDGSGGSWWQGLRHLFVLGLHHIAEGTDHLLFLLALMLPAPLLVARSSGAAASARPRWGAARGSRESVRAIVGVVTGFTLGHSISLALAACGVVDAPTRLVEVLVAGSIGVSALHAWRSVFAGREVWIASAFGLVHGLAFAETLSGLDFDGATLALSLVGFNLGIEAMQLAVIAATLPLLLWLATTRAYPALRIAGAAFAAACAAGWVAERAFGLANPLAPVVDALAPPPPWFVAAVAAASIACAVALVRRRLRASSAPDRAGAPAARSAACAHSAR
jgi:hypothetical protein